MTPIEYLTSCEIFRQLLNCVEYLHSLEPKIIHRDLKPANILITNNYSNHCWLKICDFNLATNQQLKTISRTYVVGTIRYIAPEVQQGNRYREHADIYSLGQIACELFVIDLNE